MRIPKNALSPAVLLCWLTFATANDKTETCQNSDGSACVATPTRRKAWFANYAPDKEEDEQEDVNEADLMMHMQMRLNVDTPVDAEAAPTAVTAAGTTSADAVKAHEESQKGAKLSLSGAAARPPYHGVAAEAATIVDTKTLPGQQQPAAAAPKLASSVQQHPEMLSLLEESAVSSPVAASNPPGAIGQSPGARSQPEASSFLTGNQGLLGAAVGAVLVILGALLATAIRTCVAGRKGLSEDELRAAAKAWMLDWALGYEPDDKDDEPIEAELKIRNKKQPPMATASDSGDTDEEEPEAESDSGDLLEDAVFVAEQVEVANEAADAGYGLEKDGRLVDQIRRDLR